MLSKIWLTDEVSLQKRQMEKANVVKNVVWSICGCANRHFFIIISILRLIEIYFLFFTVS